MVTHYIRKLDWIGLELIHALYGVLRTKQVSIDCIAWDIPCRV
jgi:hypothetical protein